MSSVCARRWCATDRHLSINFCGFTHSGCQGFVDAARAAEAEVIRYRSGRDSAGRPISRFLPSLFAADAATARHGGWAQRIRGPSAMCIPPPGDRINMCSMWNLRYCCCSGDNGRILERGSGMPRALTTSFESTDDTRGRPFGSNV